MAKWAVVWTGLHFKIFPSYFIHFSWCSIFHLSRLDNGHFLTSFTDSSRVVTVTSPVSVFALEFNRSSSAVRFLLLSQRASPLLKILPPPGWLVRVLTCWACRPAGNGAGFWRMWKNPRPPAPGQVLFVPFTGPLFAILLAHQPSGMALTSWFSSTKKAFNDPPVSGRAL